MTFVKPEIVSSVSSRAPRLTGPDRATNGIVIAIPTSITQASVEAAPISRALRAEQRMDTDQQMAAPRPPRMGITVPSVASRWPHRVASATMRLRAVTRVAPAAQPITRSREVRPLAKTPRTWTGARTPSGLKRVRQAERRREILQPRRTAAKTYVAKALEVATHQADPETAATALAEAHAALDRAAKAGAIHPNAAARRKSRLTLKFNAATGGAHVQTSTRDHQDDEQGPGREGRQEPDRCLARPTRQRAPRRPPARPAPRCRRPPVPTQRPRPLRQPQPSPPRRRRRRRPRPLRSLQQRPRRRRRPRRPQPSRRPPRRGPRQEDRRQVLARLTSATPIAPAPSGAFRFERSTGQAGALVGDAIRPGLRSEQAIEDPAPEGTGRREDDEERRRRELLVPVERA